MNSTYIFDIDGTIANISHRLDYIMRPKPAQDWFMFYKQCINDVPMPDVINILRRLAGTGASIIFVTGRNEICREETTKWLNKYVGVKDYTLLMRSEHDHREDAELKKDIYNKEVKNKFFVIGVFEDRKQCVDMWRGLGLTCYQVANGDY